MKNRRDVCYAKDAGFIGFEGLAGSIKTGCQLPLHLKVVFVMITRTKLVLCQWMMILTKNLESFQALLWGHVKTRGAIKVNPWQRPYWQRKWHESRLIIRYYGNQKNEGNDPRQCVRSVVACAMSVTSQSTTSPTPKWPHISYTKVYILTPLYIWYPVCSMSSSVKLLIALSKHYAITRCTIVFWEGILGWSVNGMVWLVESMWVVILSHAHAIPAWLERRTY